MAQGMRTKLLLGAGGAIGAALIADRLSRSPMIRFARMAGTSIAAPDAVGWITDFLNAAYYRRPPGLRQVDDLRLAFSIFTTYWHRAGHHRLRAYDVVPFHRAFGPARFLDGRRSDHGLLSREQLLAGATQLFGGWFADAYADAGRRGWGIVFESSAERADYHPEVRARTAALGPLTPPVAPGREQIWHTYPPVPVASAERVVAALSRTETWPDYGSEVGRFVAMRKMGLAGQTFEIIVIAHPTPRTPVMTRGYVTITRLVSRAEPDALRDYIAELNDGMLRFGRDEPQPVPTGAELWLAFDLTTHEGHFMGAARNRLLLYEQAGQAYLRAAGTWDPMPWYINQPYRRMGYAAQQAFWGVGTPEESMLHQIALATLSGGDRAATTIIGKAEIS